jgi:hypothetical protein
MGTRITLNRKHSPLVWALFILPILALTVLAAYALPARADGEPERVAIGTDLVIAVNETVNGDVSVTGGDLTIEGTVEGDAIVVNGSTFIKGTVGGDVVVTGGSVTLRNGSEVAGDVIYVGGSISQEPGANVLGDVSRLELSLSDLGNAVPISNVAAPDPQDGSRGPFDRLSTLIILSVLSMGLLAASIALLLALPRRVRITGATLEAEGGASVIVGLISAGLVGPLTALLTSLLMVTGIGWVLIPILWAFVAAFLIFGLVTVSLWLGRRVYDTAFTGVVHTSGRHTGQTGILEKVPPLMFQMLLGLTVILLSVVVPAALIAGWVAWILLLLVYVAACLGLGAALLSRFGTLMPPKGITRAGRPVEYYGAGNTAPLGSIPGSMQE